MAEVTYIHPAMQCVDDTAHAAKRAYADNRANNPMFALKAELLAMSCDLMLNRMSMDDYVSFVVAALEDKAS